MFIHLGMEALIPSPLKRLLNTKQNTQQKNRNTFESGLDGHFERPLVAPSIEGFLHFDALPPGQTPEYPGVQEDTGGVGKD
jgi:hypothetical protein